MVLGSWSSGSIVGPLIGGVLVEKASWRWCFHINYPFCGIGFVVALMFVRLNPVEKLTFAQKLERMDWLGALLFVGGMTSFLVGLSWGGIQHPWKSAATLGPIFIGLATLGVFLAWHLYAQERALLPMSIFCNYSTLAAFYSALINGLVVSRLLIIGQVVFQLILPALHSPVLQPVLRDERPG